MKKIKFKSFSLKPTKTRKTTVLKVEYEEIE
jgi:hypothetical protein